LEIAKRAAAQAGRQVQDAEKRIKRLREAQEKADTSLRNAETECNTADAALLSLREQVALTKSAVDKLR
jgi:vacuolar-type H+-ATPase subunit H